MGNLIDAAKADGRLGTLLKAIEAAGIYTLLSAVGPFTLFARRGLEKFHHLDFPRFCPGPMTLSV